MKFNNSGPIYLQIADFIMENVLAQKWQGGERIPSVREMAADVEVNPNTIVRTYNMLNELGIIYNQRGIGYFLSMDARQKALDYKKAHFIQEELPQFFKAITLLNIDFKDIQKRYQNYLTYENK